MARILLVTLYDEFNLGVRQLVAELRAEGHEACLLCLKQYRKQELGPGEEWYPFWQTEATPWGTRRILAYPAPLTPHEIALFEDLLRRLRPQFVGLSVYTAFVPQARQITEIVRRTLPGATVAWGGPHVTCDPVGAAEFCDVAFVGECDVPMVEFARALDLGRDWRQTPNIIWREQGKIHQQPVSPVVKDLDTLPFTFYGADGAYYLDNDELVEGRPFPTSGINTYFKILTARGCPYACTFCMISHEQEVMPDTARPRFRSIGNCIRELEEAMARMGNFYLEIEDDIFTVRPDRMKAFFELYSQRIRMPFWCYTHPNYARPEALKILKENNVEFVVMGIQSGSDRIAAQVFDRRVKNATIVQAARNIHDAGVRAFYDIITNNPFETEEDRIATFNLLRQLPKPYALQMGVLIFYPNLPVSRERERLGLPVTGDFQQYRFWNALYYLASTVDFTDAQAAELIANQHLRSDPSLLESIATATVRLNRENGDLANLSASHLREVHRLAARLTELENELHFIKARRGLKQFLWLSDSARRLKRRLFHRNGAGRHVAAAHGASAPAVSPGEPPASQGVGHKWN
jgi:radical SAM superfamily enzyme YgiQ (UPF0313 family)